MLELAFPWALVALPLAALVLWLAPARRETVQAVRFPFFEGASAGLDKGEGAVVLPRSWPQMAFGWALWALILLTLARPEWVGPPVERSEAARDVMLAVDISGSMATKDFATPDDPHQARLDGVKSVLDGFIAGRRDDRVGLIAFGSAPYVLVPFTRDTAAARSLLATLVPGMAGQNTVLGDAIGLAIRSFEASKVEARVLILLSDGSDTASRMAPPRPPPSPARTASSSTPSPSATRPRTTTRTAPTRPRSRRLPTLPAAASTAPATRPGSRRSTTASTRSAPARAPPSPGARGPRSPPSPRRRRRRWSSRPMRR